MRFATMMRISLLALGLALLPVTAPWHLVPEAAADGDKDKDKDKDKDDDKKKDREARKAAKEAEKEAKKAAKEAEKEAKRQAREAAKAAKEAEKEAKRQAREAAKAAKEAEKDAKRQARENRKQAKELSKNGLEHLEKGEHEQAVAAFSKAYELDPLSEHLYNLAVAYHLNRDKRKAYESYQKYLASNPDNQSMIEQATKYSAELKLDLDAEDATLARIKALEDQVARERQDKEKMRKDNDEAMRKVSEELEAQRQQAARAAQASAPATTGSTGTGAGGGKRTLGTSMLAVGGVALGAAIFYGLDARSANAELDGLGADDIFTESRAWLHDRGETAESRMLIFSIAGATLVAGGAVVYYLGEREGKRPAPIERGDVAVTPAVGPTSAGVQVSGSF